MTATADNSSQTSLLEQRRLLRRKIAAQRQRIAQRLAPSTALHTGYPRSRTMKFLSRQPALAAGLLAAVARLLVGARFFRTMTMALAVTRMLNSLSANAGRTEPVSTVASATIET